MKPFPAILLAALVVSGCRFAGLGDRNQANQSAPRTSPSDEGGKGQNEAPGSESKDILFDSLPPDAPRRLPPGLRDFQEVFADVAEKAIPAVVSIYSQRNIADPEGPYDDFQSKGPFQYFFDDPNSKRSPPTERKETGLGSGVIISPSGYILTNNHVIEGAVVIKVQLLDESEYAGSIVGTDKASDLAVIKIEVKSRKLPTLPLGNSDKLRIGEWVLAVGNPYGLSHTVTTGIISAKGRKNTGITSYENFIQTDAAINPGNSGGALLNLSGELIGINTAIFSRSGGYQGIGFAIPINTAKKITKDLIRDGEVTRGWLGVSILPIDPDLAAKLGVKGGKEGQAAHGAMVGGVVPESPAEKAGLRRGDVISKVGNLEIKDPNELLNCIALLIPNQSVDIHVLRDGVTLLLKARIVKRDEKRVMSYHGEEDPQPALVGLQVAELTKELKERFGLDQSLKRGVIVLSVKPGSRAGIAKILPGDVLLEINRIPVLDLATFRTAMSQAVKGNKIILQVSREGHKFFTPL